MEKRAARLAPVVDMASKAERDAATQLGRSGQAQGHARRKLGASNVRIGLRCPCAACCRGRVAFRQGLRPAVRVRVAPTNRPLSLRRSCNFRRFRCVEKMNIVHHSIKRE